VLRDGTGKPRGQRSRRSVAPSPLCPPGPGAGRSARSRRPWAGGTGILHSAAAQRCFTRNSRHGDAVGAVEARNFRRGWERQRTHRNVA
jgi:hypothetical protein